MCRGVVVCALFSVVSSVVFFSCGRAAAPPVSFAEEAAVFAKSEGGADLALFAIAEAERARGFKPGMGLRESSILEKDGDYAGAVIAAFKDLCWAYSYDSGGGTTIEVIRSSLQKVRELYSNDDVLSDEQKSRALAAVDAADNFICGKYSAAKKILTELFIDNSEPDSFSHWMKLVCTLEEGEGGVSSYSAIRARYELLPAYWYFGARNMPLEVSGEYAERCINTSPDGPYSDEARRILAVFAGLKTSDGPAMRSKYEIESFITLAVNNNSPDILKGMLPLLALNDNPYTLYASGAMRALSARENFRNWYNVQAENGAKNRLEDRLKYIARG
jgi:hypothetical protein